MPELLRRYGYETKDPLTRAMLTMVFLNLDMKRIWRQDYPVNRGF